MFKSLWKVPSHVATPYDQHQFFWRYFDAEPGSASPFIFHMLRDRTRAIVLSSVRPRENEYMENLSEYIFTPQVGRNYHFAARVNPSKRLASTGKRVLITGEDEIIDWFAGKLEGSGSGRIHKIWISAPLEKKSFFKAGRKTQMPVTIGSVEVEGLLECRDSEKLKKIVEQGIGSGKSFGFGMLILMNS